jgi:heme-degrading monooxygenase HmoA
VASDQRGTWHYVVIWEFIVRVGEESRFEAAYGPQGDWVRCFQQGPGYLGTELNHDLSNRRRYVTMDFWSSQTVYENFKAQHAAEYQAIDCKCADLTEQERRLGEFERVEN